MAPELSQFFPPSSVPYTPQPMIYNLQSMPSGQFTTGPISGTTMLPSLSASSSHSNVNQLNNGATTNNNNNNNNNINNNNNSNNNNNNNNGNTIHHHGGMTNAQTPTLYIQTIGPNGQTMLQPAPPGTILQTQQGPITIVCFFL